MVADQLVLAVVAAPRLRIVSKALSTWPATTSNELDRSVAEDHGGGPAVVGLNTTQAMLPAVTRSATVTAAFEIVVRAADVTTMSLEAFSATPTTRGPRKIRPRRRAALSPDTFAPR